MKEERFFYVPDAARRQELPADEAAHALRVLRLKEGDAVVLMDGQGTFYRAVISQADSRHCLYDIIEAQPQQRTWQGRLHLAIAPTKMMERMEWLVEKATEVGIDRLTLLDCRFSERRVVKTQRLEKIAVAAAKQSRKAWMPEITDMQPFRHFITEYTSPPRGESEGAISPLRGELEGAVSPLRGELEGAFIAHCYDEVPRQNLFEALKALRPIKPTEPTAPITPTSPLPETLVLVGPEGDFSIDEVRMAVDAGFVSVDLGRSRLRTETAGLAALMMMHLSQQP